MTAPSFTYTPRQRQVMAYVRDRLTRDGVSPTIREIGEVLRVRESTAHQHVLALLKKGAIEFSSASSRRIVVMDPVYQPKLICPSCRCQISTQLRAIAELPAKSVVEVLLRMRDRLEEPGAWCQGAMAKDRAGDAVAIRSPAACAWSMEAALRIAAGGVDELLYGAANILDHRCGSLHHFNDSPGTDHEKVLKFLDESIDFAKHEKERAA